MKKKCGNCIIGFKSEFYEGFYPYFESDLKSDNMEIGLLLEEYDYIFNYCPICRTYC